MTRIGGEDDPPRMAEAPRAASMLRLLVALCVLPPGTRCAVFAAWCLCGSVRSSLSGS